MSVNRTPRESIHGKNIQCNECGVLFYAQNCEIKDGRKFCSRKCSYIGRNCTMLFQKGHPDLVPPEKRKHSDKTKQKISEYQRANRKIGEEHPNYKNGGRTKRKKEMGRFEYREWRRKVFERDSFMCIHCHSSDYLHADHIIPWKDNIGLRYDVSNGRTLCFRCHYKITFGKYDSARALLWGVPVKYRNLIKNI